MGATKVEYVELASAKVSESRNAVISSRSLNGFTIAQQLAVQEGPKTTTVFLKGALHIESLEGLINLRDAVNVAIEKFDELTKEKAEGTWD